MGLYSSIEVSASGLSAERLAMDVIANNLANANTTRTPEGGSFKRQLVVFAQKQEQTQTDSLDPTSSDPINGDPNASRAGVEAVAIVPDSSPDRLPNVDVVKEMVDMIAASRAYQANVTAIQEARSMGSAALGVLKS
jgi:flagellar basal-body rod protein FlgC